MKSNAAAKNADDKTIKTISAVESPISFCSYNFSVNIDVLSDLMSFNLYNIL
jgi:hypothetical protein